MCLYMCMHAAPARICVQLNISMSPVPLNIVYSSLAPRPSHVFQWNTTKIGWFGDVMMTYLPSFLPRVVKMVADKYIIKSTRPSQFWVLKNMGRPGKEANIFCFHFTSGLWKFQALFINLVWPARLHGCTNKPCPQLLGKHLTHLPSRHYYTHHI